MCRYFLTAQIINYFLIINYLLDFFNNLNLFVILTRSKFFVKETHSHHVNNVHDFSMD